MKRILVKCHQLLLWLVKKIIVIYYMRGYSVLVDGSVEKVMSRKTIAKYFKHLEDRGFIKLNEEDEYYYLTVLDSSEANLIEYNTLSKLLNVM